MPVEYYIVEDEDNNKVNCRTMSLENRVPVVDLAEIIRPDSRELNSKSPYLAKVVKNIQNACIQWGFFYVTGHGVSDQLINELKSVSKEFFKKSKDFKKQVQRQPVRNYFDLIVEFLSA